jgi:hypothetical protein
MNVKTTGLIERLVALEADIKYQELAVGEEPEFAYSLGQIPILVSAPHGAAHMRYGRYKGEDEYTAAFARLIADECGAHCIYARRKSRTDPNAALDAPYKAMVDRICKNSEIQFVLDLHGMGLHHNAGIELGTRDGKSCPEQKELIIQTLSESGFTLDNVDKLMRLRVDAQFSGNGSSTREPMVKFVSEKLSIPAAQVELNAWNRIVIRREDAAENDKSFQGEPGLIEQTARALIKTVNVIQES